MCTDIDGSGRVTTDLIIRNCRPMGGQALDVLLRGGRIAKTGKRLAAPGAGVEDARGALLLPGLVEAHTHLDKTLWGMAWYKNEVGPRLLDKIDNERASRKRLGIDPARQSARQVVLSLSKGTTHIRSHVDVDTDHGMAGIAGVMATRERYRKVMDIEIVAFPQSGLLRRPGTVELMDEALRLGSEVVGGLDPCAIDRDPKGHLDTIFAMAQRHARPIESICTSRARWAPSRWSSSSSAPGRSVCAARSPSATPSASDHPTATSSIR
jgi:cytosine/adenosine deaminase-related metal-dependent hydrolase